MHNDPLELRSLADAMAFAMFLADDVDGDTFSAAWLGDADGTPLEFLVDEQRSDVDHLVAIAMLVPDVAQLVLWRSADVDADALDAASTFLDRRTRLADADITLHDELLCAGDLVRSMAVSSFSDADGWDDVSEALARLDDPDAA